MRLLLFSLLFFYHLIGTSQIRVAEPIQYLGDIFESSGKVHSQFKLTNPYRQDTIHILDIVTSCGCTAILTQDTVLLPLSSIDLQFTYDPKGRVGLFLKSIEITTRTGKEEINKLFLKIQGNVVAENYSVKKVDAELINYKVAPIYFYPVTAYDTAYLDFNYISSFVNDVSYEIDFYQFTTLGIEVGLRNTKELEQFETLCAFAANKIRREFYRRGYNATTLFFEEPIFKIDSTLPPWSRASLKIYSSNFNAAEAESEIKVTTDEIVENYKLLLDETRFAFPTVEEVLDKVNYESIEGKLFLNQEMVIKGMIEMPWKKSQKEKEKFAKLLEKDLFKRIKENTGIKKRNLRIEIDSIGIHPKDKYHFLLWDEADMQILDHLKYEVKEDEIVIPQLPTYQDKFDPTGIPDTANADFQHFWANLVLAPESVDSVVLKLIATYSYSENNKTYILSKAQELADTLSSWYHSANGHNLTVEIVPLLNGPKFTLLEKDQVALNPATFTLIPLIERNVVAKRLSPNPYMVNFDFFFKGIDTEAIGFKSFAEGIAAEVNQSGFVELRIESGISKIPVDDFKSNKIVAYERIIESEKRLREALKALLVDPNRIIFIDENIAEQGPEYDGSIPVLKYRKYHYLRIIPESNFKN